MQASNRQPKVLVVAAEQDTAATIVRAIRDVARSDFTLDANDAAEKFETSFYDAMIVDASLPTGLVSELIARCSRIRPTIPIIGLCQEGQSIPGASALLRPASPDQIANHVRSRLAESAAARSRDFERFHQIPAGRPLENAAISNSFNACVERASAVARGSAPVLIVGESGSGKEVIADLIRQKGRRPPQQFRAVNSGGIPATLIESTLFGYIKGAFTGAVGPKEGMFEAANGGTLFLDEIGDMPPEVQVSLLRTLETGEIYPVGASHPKRVDVRVIAATHRDLLGAVREGRFRADLYYRLAVAVIRVPPLRDRPEDVEPLAADAVRRWASDVEHEVRRISPAAIEKLCRHSWPGNVRELYNVVRRAMPFAESGEIQADHIELDPPSSETEDLLTVRPYAAAEQIFRKRYMTTVLAQCGGNKSEAARIAHVSRGTFD